MPRKPAKPTDPPLKLVPETVEKSGNASERDDDENNGPDLEPQKHGGALRRSGKIGNKGGPGRPKSTLSGLAEAKAIGRRVLPGMMRELKRRFYGEKAKPAQPAKGDRPAQPAQPAKRPTVYDQTRIAETVSRIVALGEKDLSHEGKRPARAEVMGAGLPDNPQQAPQQAEPQDTKPQPAQPPTAAPLA